LFAFGHTPQQGTLAEQLLVDDDDEEEEEEEELV
jgi:hypothetical protein